MECALIPPIHYLSYNKKQKYQLMLPHLLSNGTYRRHYRKHCQSEDKFVILDNGAAESEKTSAYELLAIARAYEVQEVVAPDALANLEGTIELSAEFLRLVHKDHPKCHIGIVAQGQSLEEAMMCVTALMAGWGEDIDTIYLPRLLVSTVQPFARVKMAEVIHKRFPDKMIHMLGASRFFLQEPIAIAKNTPFVRSIDTSVPFSEAMRGQLLETSRMQGFNRPPNYFEWGEVYNEEILKRNVERYLAWTKGESTPPLTAKLAL